MKTRVNSITSCSSRVFSCFTLPLAHRLIQTTGRLLVQSRPGLKVVIHMLADAFEKNCDQQVLVSNDSDFVPVLEMIRNRSPEMALELVIPIPHADKGNRQLQPNKALNKLCHWSRWPISLNVLEETQLPDKIPTNKKPIRKPERWA